MALRGGNLPLEHIVYIVKEIASGLDYAHRCLDGVTGRPLNIIHRDISPQNVMINFEGEVKIVDFGIAKAANQLEKTMAGTLKGKFSYMSPEQAYAKSVDHRTDIFSLGIILWELLANKRLFSASNEIEVLKKVQKCLIPDIKQINPFIHPILEKILLKTLEASTKMRYQRSESLYKDLNKFLNQKYPDFSSHDFSSFIRELYNEETHEIKKRLVTYANLSSDLSSISNQSAPSKSSENERPKNESSESEGLKNKGTSSSSSKKTLKKEDHTFATDITEKTFEPIPEVSEKKDKTSLNEKKKNFSEDFDDKTKNLNLHSLKNSNSVTENSLSLNQKNPLKANEPSDESHEMEEKSSFTLEKKTSSSLSPLFSSTASSNRLKEDKTNEKKETQREDLFPLKVYKEKKEDEKKLVKGKKNKEKSKKEHFHEVQHNSSQVQSQPSFYKTPTPLKENLQKSSKNPSSLLPILFICFFVLGGYFLFHPNQKVQKIVKKNIGKFQHLIPFKKESSSHLNSDFENSIPRKLASKTKEPLKSFLIVNSQPSGSRVYINGKDTGKTTPNRIEILSQSQVTLKLMKNSYKDYIKTINLKEKGNLAINVKLIKKFSSFLNINAIPHSGVKIYINDKLLDKTSLPIVKYPVRFGVELRIKAYSSVTKVSAETKVTLKKGETRSLRFNMNRRYNL